MTTPPRHPHRPYPRLRLGADEDTLDAPPSLPADRGPVRHADESVEDELVHDELAALFLGPRTKPAEPTEPQRRSIGASVEIALLGHLPTRATLWIRQYADAIAAQGAAPVGLIRASGGALRIDAVRPGPEPLIEGDAPTANAALDAIRRGCEEVVLLTDEIGQVGLASTDDVGVAILTAANDAAIIHAYKLIKAVAAIRPARETEIRVVIVGATPDVASHAYRRLKSTAERFLEVDLIRGPTIERAGMCNARTLYAGADARSASDILRSLVGGVSAPPASTPTPPQRTPVQPASPAPSSPTKPRLDESTDDPRDRGRDPSRPDIYPLHQWIEALTPIDAPRAMPDHVEVAIDRSGAVRLVASPRHIPDLLRAARWWKLNGSLAARADDRIRNARPTLHVVTDDPQAASGLSGGPFEVALVTVGVAEGIARRVAVRPSPPA
ncbi:MAG: hypothetical protein CMJ31_13585 [Phycisphaerae bacterium]|nr:hypothetical protein [Phycisphaerae bacterium]